uniref:Uncharacterized protein n=1 Tax=Oryza brachyantha TaxID=4533 RepID=J3L5R8_ORYBR
MQLCRLSIETTPKGKKKRKGDNDTPELLIPFVTNKTALLTQSRTFLCIITITTSLHVGRLLYHPNFVGNMDAGTQHMPPP